MWTVKKKTTDEPNGNNLYPPRPKRREGEEPNYPSLSEVACHRRGFFKYALAGFALAACDEKGSSKKKKRPKRHEVRVDLGLIVPFQNCPWALSALIFKTKDKVFAEALSGKEAKKAIMETLAVSFQTASCNTLAQPATRRALQQKVGQGLAGTFRKDLKRSLSPPKVIFVMKRSHGKGKPMAGAAGGEAGMEASAREGEGRPGSSARAGLHREGEARPGGPGPRGGRRDPREVRPGDSSGIVRKRGSVASPERPHIQPSTLTIRPGDGSRRVQKKGRPRAPRLRDE